MSRPRTTAGKRNVQQQKREKARAKQDRRAAREEIAPAVPAVPLDVGEAELIDELAAIHRMAEDGTVTPEEFELRRELIRQQLEQIDRGTR